MFKILKFLPLLLFPITTLANIDACFTPQENCTQQIVNKIDSANKTLLIQSFSFTSKPIIFAILKAHKRGVLVKIELDKSQINSFGYKTLKPLGIFIAIDNKVKIAHNKVMIIDNHLLITGSFNFSASAQHYNAENVIFIYKEKVIKKYIDNFNYRLKEIKRY